MPGSRVCPGCQRHGRRAHGAAPPRGEAQRVPAPCPSMGAPFCSGARAVGAPSAGHTPSPCRAWEGTAPRGTCREWGSAGRGPRRRGERAPVNPTQFIIRPEQLSLEICLYQVSSSELHPRTGFGRLLVPPGHLLLQPPQQLPLESPQPCRGPGRRCRHSEGLPGAGAQSRAGTAGAGGGRAHRAGLGPVPRPKACGVPAQ